MNIYLTGLIGAGKTAVGQALARRLGWLFDDIDTAMERTAGKGFREVVAEEGWLGFRQREYSICKEFARMHRTVIALGGGTPRYEWNRDVLKGTGVTILLLANLNVLAERVRDHDRPRVNVGATLEEDLARMWQEHEHVYTAFADVHYRTDEGKSITEEVDELLAILRRGYSPDLA